MSTDELPHLSAAVRPQTAMDTATRILNLRRDRWINYPRAVQALEQLQRLIETPERERMPCMILHGESDIGKTQIIRKFQRQHAPAFDDKRGVERHEIIAMQMPATPDQHRFYTALLFELHAPHSDRASLSTLERLTRDLLRRIQPRMLIVDEVHNLLTGSYREQRASLNLLKYLANDLRMAIVLVGTEEARIALQTDAQMTSSFVPFEIPRWRENDEFRRLLSAFERVIPLRKASNLSQRSIVQFLVSRCDGLTGQLSRLLNQAAEYAIRDGSERITLSHLNQINHAAV